MCAIYARDPQTVRCVQSTFWTFFLQTKERIPQIAKRVLCKAESCAIKSVHQFFMWLANCALRAEHFLHLFCRAENAFRTLQKNSMFSALQNHAPLKVCISFSRDSQTVLCVLQLFCKTKNRILHSTICRTCSRGHNMQAAESWDAFRGMHIHVGILGFCRLQNPGWIPRNASSRGLLGFCRLRNPRIFTCIVFCRSWDGHVHQPQNIFLGSARAPKLQLRFFAIRGTQRTCFIINTWWRLFRWHLLSIIIHAPRAVAINRPLQKNSLLEVAKMSDLLCSGVWHTFQPIRRTGKLARGPARKALFRHVGD